MSHNKKILITGGAGFIGSKLKDRLKQLGFEVLTIGRDQTEDYVAELTDTSLEKIIFDFSPDVVCHLASGSNIERANKNKEQEFKNVVLGTECLIKALTKISSSKPVRVIYLSSQVVYGFPESLPVGESHPLKPVTVYGENKLRAENVLIQSNLDYLIFRVSSVYGPNQNHLKSGTIAKFINKMKANESPVVFNGVDLFSDFIYVTDLVDVIVLAITNSSLKNEVFNLGSGMPTSLKEILEHLYLHFPHAPKYVLIENTLYGDKDHKGIYLDIKKIKNTFPWVPKYSIGDGIKGIF